MWQDSPGYFEFISPHSLLPIPYSLLTKQEGRERKDIRLCFVTKYTVIFLTLLAFLTFGKQQLSLSYSTR